MKVRIKASKIEIDGKRYRRDEIVDMEDMYLSRCSPYIEVLDDQPVELKPVISFPEEPDEPIVPPDLDVIDTYNTTTQSVEVVEPPRRGRRRKISE